jgi:hypothetical protein
MAPSSACTSRALGAPKFFLLACAARNFFSSCVPFSPPRDNLTT